MAGTHTRQPISLTLLAGLYDGDSPLSLLRGCPHVLGQIWRELQQYWAEVVTLPGARLPDDDYPTVSVDADRGQPQPFFLAPINMDPLTEESSPTFPRPDPSAPININMMPFIAGNSFKESKLPKYLEPYWGLIDRCLTPEKFRTWHHLWPKARVPSEIGKVFYLTVQESFVESGTSQRRPGLHVDCPGAVNIKNEEALAFVAEGSGYSQPFSGHAWGRGCAHYVGGCEQRLQGGSPAVSREEYSTWEEWEEELQKIKKMTAVLQGGIYLASSLPSSCRAWNCSVDLTAVGRLGDVEHLREAMAGPGLGLEAGQLYWLTDRTPHESVPLEQAAFRQFFRLVTSEVSLWYSHHSTPNPLGVRPDPAVTKVVKGDKFSEEGVEVVEVPEVHTVNQGEKWETEEDSCEDE